MGALVRRHGYEPTALARAEPARALVCWRRRKSLLHWLRLLSLGTCARYAYVLSVYGLLIICAVFISMWAWQRSFPSGQPSELIKLKEEVEINKKNSSRRGSKKNRDGRRQNAPSRRRDGGSQGAIASDGEAESSGDAEIRESAAAAEPPPLSNSDSKNGTADRSASPQAKLSSLTPKATNEKSTDIDSLARGTAITAVFIAPVRSAYATTATARVAADVQDTGGQVVIRAGSLIQIPLSEPDSQGHFFSDTDAYAFVTLAGGETVPINIIVESSDGAGIPGKLRKPGRWGKFLRGLAESGAAVGGGFGATREAAKTLQDSLPEKRADQGRPLGEIKSGTRFKLIVR